MFYIVYQTTNTVNGKYYIGCHQTDNIDDGYLGSGKLLQKAIQKYGKQSFSRQVLLVAKTKEEMFESERNLVTTEVVQDKLSYNLKVGGSGGNPGIVGAFAGRAHSVSAKEKQRKASSMQITSERKRSLLSAKHRAKIDPIAFREEMRKINLGKPKSEVQKKKLSEKATGKKLVNNGIVARWATVPELDNFLTNGWNLGKLVR